MKFAWGKVIEKFSYDFDGEKMDVVKYHPWKSRNCTVLTGDADLDRTEYHCEEIHESSSSIHRLVIAWIANKKLGLNNGSLVAGVCRALEI